MQRINYIHWPSGKLIGYTVCVKPPVYGVHDGLWVYYDVKD